MRPSCDPRRPCSVVSLLGIVLCAVALANPMPVGAQAGKATPGEMRWALHVTLAARWLDPAETEAFSTPFMVMYAASTRC